MDNKGLSEFIELYRESRCLWDTSDAMYANRNARKTSQQELLNVLKRYDNSANWATVRKKIDSLRTTYYRELKKVQASENGTGTDAEDLYVPTWTNYDQLKFLSEVHRVARGGSDSLDPESSLPYEDDDQETNDINSQQIGDSVVDAFRPPPPKTAKKRISAQKRLIIAAEKLASIPHVEPPDNWEAFGLSVAGDLRKMVDTKQQAIAQKIISDAIFWGKMGRLTEGSTVLLTPSPSPSPSLSVESSLDNRVNGQSPQHSVEIDYGRNYYNFSNQNCPVIHVSSKQLPNHAQPNFRNTYQELQEFVIMDGNNSEP